jgi:hypothetical protein
MMLVEGGRKEVGRRGGDENHTCELFSFVA